MTTTGSGGEGLGLDPFLALGPLSPYTCSPPSGTHVTPAGASWDFTSTAAADLAAEWAAAGVAYCSIRLAMFATANSGDDGNCPPGFFKGNVTPEGDPGGCQYIMAGFGPLQVGDFEGIYDGAIAVSRSAFGGDTVADRGGGAVSGVSQGIIPIPAKAGPGPGPFQNFVSDGMMLRPTSLTWDAQDPDNGANRCIWATSEVGSIEVLGSAMGSNIVHLGYAISLTPTWVVVGMVPVPLPTACSPNDLPDPPGPVNSGTIRFGPSPGGIRRLGDLDLKPN